MSVVVVGLSHRTVPLDLLERMAIPRHRLPKALGDLAARPFVSEVALLSTCHRIEAYVVAERFHGAVQDVRHFLSELAFVPPEEFSDHLYTYYDEAVANGGDFAYIGGDGIAIGVVDLHDPHNPVIVKVIPVAVRQAFINGNRLVVRSDDGLNVYDITNPLDPIATAFVSIAAPGVSGPIGSGALVWNGDTLMRTGLGFGDLEPSGLRVLAPMQIDSAGLKTVVADRYALRVFGPNTAPPPPPPAAPPPRRHAARP